MNPIEIKFSVKPKSFPTCDPKSSRLEHGDTHLFVSKLTPADEQATQALQNREIIVFNKVSKEKGKAKERHVVPISSNCTSSLSAANPTTLEEHLSIKFFRSLNLSLLMTLIPWNSGCPTALLTTVKQGGKGFAGQEALHSSMQPGLALYADKANMFAMIKKLITDIILNKIFSLNQIEEKSLTEIICIALLNYDLRILTHGLSNPKLKQIVENASRIQNELNTSLKKKLPSQPKELEICLKKWIEENGEDLKKYKNYLQNLQETVASLEEEDLSFDDGENILAHRYVELSHSAVDVFPQELNMLDSDVFEAMARPRLEFLQHLSALGKHTPNELCKSYIDNLDRLLENVNKYFEDVLGYLKTIAESWKDLKDNIHNLEDLRQRSLQGDSKAKENFINCYKNYIVKATELYKSGKLLVDYDSKKNNSFKKAKEKLNTILYISDLGIDSDQYGLSNVTQYGKDVVEVANIVLKSVVKAAQSCKGSFNKANKKKDEEKPFSEEPEEVISTPESDVITFEEIINTPKNGIITFLELKVPLLKKLSESELSPDLVKNWLTNMEKDFEELIYKLKPQEIATDHPTVNHLRKLFEEAVSNDSCLKFMQNLCIHFACSKGLKAEKKQNASAQNNLFKGVFEKVKNNNESRFDLLFNTTLHNIPLFKNKNLHSYGRDSTNSMGQHNLFESVKNSKTIKKNLISLLSDTNTTVDTNTVKEAINSFEEIGNSKTQEEEFVLARLRCAEYLLEAFTSVLESELIPPTLKNKLENKLEDYKRKYLNFYNILSSTFLTNALPLLLPRKNTGDLTSEATLYSFILLHELISLDPKALQHFQSAFKQKDKVQKHLEKVLKVDEDEKNDMITQNKHLESLSRYFSKNFLPVYSSCLESVKSYSIEKYLKDLLLSEIEIDAPLSLRSIARNFMREGSIDRLAQYTLLSTISRQYETLISRRQIPLFTAVEPDSSRITLCGKISLSPDKTFEVEFAFLQDIFEAIGSVVSGIQTIKKVEFASLQDSSQAISNNVVDETQTDETQIVVEVNQKGLDEKLLQTIEQCANCIIADLANLKAITDLANLKVTVVFNFQLHVQTYQKKVNNLLKKKRRPDNADTFI